MHVQRSGYVWAHNLKAWTGTTFQRPFCFSSLTVLFLALCGPLCDISFSFCITLFLSNPSLFIHNVTEGLIQQNVPFFLQWWDLQRVMCCRRISIVALSHVTISAGSQTSVLSRYWVKRFVRWWKMAFDVSVWIPSLVFLSPRFTSKPKTKEVVHCRNSTLWGKNISAIFGTTLGWLELLAQE